MQLKANLLMKRNIDALLRARGQTRRELARWCRRGDAWIAKIMAEDHREFPMKYFDRIADFFGIATYQLLQPGISPLTERRKGERRRVADRRVSRLVDTLRALPKLPEVEAKLRALEPENYRKVSRWIDATLLAQDHPPDSGASADPRETTAPQSKPVPRIRGQRRA